MVAGERDGDSALERARERVVREGAESRMPGRLGVLEDDAAHEEGEDARAEERRLRDAPVRRGDLAPAVGRDEAPDERQIDRRVRAAEVDPVDDAAQPSLVDEEVARVEVAVDEAVERREPQ